MLKVYITDLAAYNEGHLIGKWIELPMDSEELSQEIKSVLEEGSEASGFGEEHEEYFITDWEFTDGYEFISMSEYINVHNVNEELEKFESLDENDLKRVSFLIDNNIVSDSDEALEKYDDVIVYEDSTFADIAEEYIENTMNLDELPDLIRNNIDYQSMGHDFECDGCYHEFGSDIYYYAC